MQYIDNTRNQAIYAVVFPLFRPQNCLNSFE